MTPVSLLNFNKNIDVTLTSLDLALWRGAWGQVILWPQVLWNLLTLILLLYSKKKFSLNFPLNLVRTLTWRVVTSWYQVHASRDVSVTAKVIGDMYYKQTHFWVGGSVKSISCFKTLDVPGVKLRLTKCRTRPRVWIVYSMLQVKKVGREGWSERVKQTQRWELLPVTSLAFISSSPTFLPSPYLLELSPTWVQRSPSPGPWGKSTGASFPNGQRLATRSFQWSPTADRFQQTRCCRREKCA